MRRLPQTEEQKLRLAGDEVWEAGFHLARLLKEVAKGCGDDCPVCTEELEAIEAWKRAAVNLRRRVNPTCGNCEHHRLERERKHKRAESGECERQDGRVTKNSDCCLDWERRRP